MLKPKKRNTLYDLIEMELKKHDEGYRDRRTDRC